MHVKCIVLPWAHRPSSHFGNRYGDQVLSAANGARIQKKHSPILVPVQSLRITGNAVPSGKLRSCAKLGHLLFTTPYHTIPHNNQYILIRSDFISIHINPYQSKSIQINPYQSISILIHTKPYESIHNPT